MTVIDQLKYWLETNTKPLLVDGPAQSGKKTLLRNYLKRNGYKVLEPQESDNLNSYVDSGFTGKLAYIIRVPDLGLAKLPNVKKAPVVYVCINRYDLGLRKNELEARFCIIKLETGRNYSQKEGHAKNTTINYWEATKNILKSEKTTTKLFNVQRTGDYYSEIIFNSYLNTPELFKPTKTEAASKILEASKTADSLSFSDSVFNSKGELHCYDPDIEDCRQICNILVPLKWSGIDETKLILAKPAIGKTLKESSAKYDERYTSLPHLFGKKKTKESKKTKAPTKKRQATTKKAAPRKRTKKE